MAYLGGENAALLRYTRVALTSRDARLDPSPATDDRAGFRSPILGLSFAQFEDGPISELRAIRLELS